MHNDGFWSKPRLSDRLDFKSEHTYKASAEILLKVSSFIKFLDMCALSFKHTCTYK